MKDKESKKHKFKGESFYPSAFHYKLQNRQMEEVENCCKLLNSLTLEQIKAVEFYGKSMYEDGFDAGYDSGSDYR